MGRYIKQYLLSEELEWVKKGKAMKRNPNYKPSERQKNCINGMPYLGNNFDQTFCRKKLREECTPDVDEEKAVVANEECESCDHYKSKYIEYPIVVDEIKIEKLEGYCMYNAGIPVKIRPCGKEYEEKTYLGMYLGDQPWANRVSYNDESKVLTVKAATNPAIYVFSLHKIIYGAESWWSPIKDPEEMKDITDKEINNTWYMQLLNAMSSETK